MAKKGLRYGVMGKNKWFQKGAFKDGYQFGDITKTIFGTVADVNENINAAVFDATENLIDTAAYGVGVVGGLFNKDFQDDTGKFISQEILRPEKSGKAVTDYFDPIGWVNGLINNGDTEGNSILGENMDGMVQSAAHMAGSKALGAINPVLTPISMGVNSFGSEIEQAYQQDATHLEAGISGAVSVASEILFDKLSNGIKLLKGTNADEAVMKQLSTGISKKLLKSLMDFGIDALEEGFEETLTEITNAVGRKLTYANEKEWKEVLSSEALWNAFIGGVIMSGGANGFGMVNSTGNKADLKTELSKTEEKIVNELYKVKADEASANGVELNDNNKSEIYNSLKQKVIEGRAFANGINKIFEGKDYKEYREAVNSEQKQRSDLNSVIDAIENVPAEQRTIYQNEMLTKAKKQSEFLKYNSRADVLFKKIKDKTQAFVKSGILNDKEAGAQQKRDFFERGVQEETKNALLSKEEDATKNHEGRNNYIVPEEFIDGLWEGSKNSGYNESVKDVEKSQFETFDNDNYDWYNKNDIIIDGSHLVDGKLKLNVKYKSGEYDYIYATDGYGRISGFATKKLQFTKRIKRLKHNSNTYDKQKGDHAGHLIADRFGGSKEVDNLVSQSALVNLSEYKKMENIWAKALKNNQNVELDIQVRYEGNSKRPSGFVINYAIDGISFNRTINN